jgi:RNA polymerase sigma factor (sigma-70 family)
MPVSPLVLNDEVNLLERIRKGDEGALAELYRTHRSRIFSLVTRNSGDSDDADDMLQEALVVLWERVRSGRFALSAQVGTFLYATARNKWLRVLAGRKREVPAVKGEHELPSEDPDPLSLLVETQEALIVKQALERLGEPCRQLLVLFYWEERPMEEIAARLGFANADTAKSKKYQCKRALEKLLRGALPSYD